MKTKEVITKIVTEIIIAILGVEESEVTMDAHLRDDLGMDSLDAIELIMEFEREFSIPIPDNDAEAISTVREIINYLIEQHV